MDTTDATHMHVINLSLIDKAALYSCLDNLIFLFTCEIIGVVDQDTQQEAGHNV